MRAQIKRYSSGHPGPATHRKQKTSTKSYKRRITGTASSSPTVTTRARAARTAASAASTATAAANTEAPATTKTPAASAAGLASGAEHQQQQQRPTGATTRSRAAVFGISSIPAAAALSADSSSSSPDAAKAGVVSSKGSSSKQAAKTVICGICLDDVSSSSMYRLGCSHRFCKGCLASYLKSRLQDKQLPAACPSAGCRRPVSQGDAALLLAGNPRLRNKFIEATKEASAIARGAAIYCPNSSCSKLVKVARLTPAAARGLSTVQKAAKQQQLARVQCTHCNHICCTSCRCSWHAGLSCAAFQALPASERGDADLALFELGSSRHWRRCPTCRAMVERTDGCNYMMCRCGEPFCYACGASINTCYSSGCVAGMAAAGGW